MKSRYASSLVAIVLLASTAFASSPQRKNAGTSDPSSPQKELKAGGKPRIFVTTAAETNESWTNPATRQALEEALVNSGRFEVIAGSQRDNLLHEQGFANSDVVAPSDNVKVGRMLSARYVVSGTCQSITTTKTSTGGIPGGFGNKVPFGGGGNKDIGDKVTAKIQIQLTDLETGTIVLAKSYEQKNSENSFGTKSTDNRQEAAYRDIITNVAHQFVAELGATVPIEALVAVVDGNRVALTAGSAAGVQPGMRFEIYSEDDPIKNPATGEILSYKKTRYAVLRVATVEEKLAWAEIVKTFDNNVEDPAPNAGRIEAQMSARSLPGGGGATEGGGGGGKKKDKDKKQDN
jgi:curli biogenesis system outer membrane secretion channel CsgG